MIKKVKHGMTIGNKHTYADYKLVPTSRPVFQPPEPDRMFLTVPGRDGVIDMSTVLTGRMTYKERIGEFEFYVEKSKDWAETYSRIQNELHGTYQKVILDDDPNYYYDAFVQVDEWKSNPTFSSIVINMSAKAYKHKIKDTVVTKTLSTSEATIKCNNLREPVVPTFETTGNATIKFDTLNKTVGAGKHRLDIVFKTGENIVRASGTGTLKIIYREGGL